MLPDIDVVRLPSKEPFDFPIRTGPTVCPREISSTTTMRLEIALFSCPNRYGLKGRPDALVRTDSGELIPVDTRKRGRRNEDAKMAI